MELGQLRAFDAVARTGSFTEAGRILFLTQPGVSRAVATLEDELGLALLIRSRNGAHLTDAGRHILDQARRVLAGVEHIAQQAGAIRGLNVGSLRVGGFPSSCARLLPGIITVFEARYPHITVTLHEDYDHEIIQQLKRHELDLGFVHLPVPDLACTTIAVDEMRLVLPATHPYATAGELVDIADLAGEPFIQPRGRSEPIIRALFHKAGIDPRIRFTPRDVSTVLAMITEGMGIGIIADIAIPAIGPHLAVKAITPTSTRGIGIATRRNEKPLPAANAFIETAKSWKRTNFPDTTPPPEFPSNRAP